MKFHRLLTVLAAGALALTVSSVPARADEPATSAPAAAAHAAEPVKDAAHGVADSMHDAANHAAPEGGAATGHDAHAAGGHGEHEVVEALPNVKQGIATGVTALVVFALVCAFMLAVVWPKINKGLDDRASKIRNEIEAAELAQRQARSALEQYQKNLDEARAEAQRMLDQAKAQQQAIAAELKTKADAELAMMREKARRDIESAKRAALNEIYSEASTLATSIAGKILQRELGPQDQQRLVEQSLNEMRSMARA
mgnify:FL=1